MNRKYQQLLGMVVMITLPLLAHGEIAAPDEYKIDPSHSSILFTISHMGFSVLTGRFNNFAGNMVINPKGRSQLNVTIETVSVDTNHAKRDEHPSSPDFLNVKQFPKIHFISTQVKFNSRGEVTQVLGKLTLHGKTNSVILVLKPVGAGKDPWGGYRAGYNATTIIKRSSYGMQFMQGGVGDDIKITLNIETIKQ